MKPITFAYLLAPMGAMAGPCRHQPSSSSTAAEVTPSGTTASSLSTEAPPTTTTVPTTSSTAEVPPTVTPSVTTTSITSAATSASASATKQPTGTTQQPAPTAGSGIDALFKAKGKLYFGTAADAGTLSKAANAALIDGGSDFGQLTPENSMKWDAIEPSRGAFSFAGADALVAHAEQHGLSVRGHTLLWYQQLPAYVEAIADAAELTRVIEDHVSAVVGRYKGRVRAWDVVNEIFAEDGGLRDCVFSRVLGEDFVRIAFEAARAADPDAKLYINDYHLESGTAAKVTAGMVPHVKKWLAAGVPIDGIGSQGHLGGANGDASGELAGLQALASTGVSELAITELDIDDAPADQYVAVVDACLAVEACVGITVWGVSDAFRYTEFSPHYVLLLG
ncbi:Endo-1,4-beta-xylanase 2 [Diatrype stigma]|uniref:Beta-xylanase n=1 Tax=Diatrype stigma TaxID=117547 RepID=A0AAN9UIZ0_9PEZI